VFTGYFGPIGVGALYYALVATEKLPDDFETRNSVIAATTFIVFCSIVVHGTSAPLFMLASSIPSRFAADIASASPDHSPVRSEPHETDALLSGNRPRSWLDTFRGLRPTTNAAEITREQLDAIIAGQNTFERGGRHGQAYSAMGDPETHRHRPTRRPNNEGQTDISAEQIDVSQSASGQPQYQVFDEGSYVVLDDGEGHVEVRRVSVRNVSRDTGQ